MEVPIPEQRVLKAIRRYFKSENHGALTLLLWSMLALATTFWFFFKIGEPMEMGAAYPLGLLGLIQFFAGLFVLLNSIRLKRKTSDVINHRSSTALQIELERMKKVMANFENLK